MNDWFPRLFSGTYAGRRVLVTGHTGFKGSWLVLWLHAMGARVAGLSLPAEGPHNHAAALNLGIDETIADLADAQAVHEAVCQFEPEIVFHLAAQSLVRKSYREPVATFRTNVIGLVNVLEAVRARKTPPSVFFTSTNKVYGALDWLALERGPQGYAPKLEPIRAHGVSESAPLDFHSPYGCSKGCGDQYVNSFFRRISRKTFIPQSCSSASGNRMVLNGMRTSSVQPPSKRCVAASHRPSQLALNTLPSSCDCVSRSTPAAFTLKL